VAAALIVGLGVAAAMADDSEGDGKSAPAKSGWWSSWFAEKPKTKPKAEKKPPVEDRPAPPSMPESPAAQQQREMNAVLRRMEVCDRLRTIALETGNDELMRQAEALEARAQELYRQHTAQLPAAEQAVEETKPVETKPAAKKSDKGLDEPARARRRTAAGDGLKRMGMDFESRERDILKDTGRDRP
jgi:hypothetical protein